jgi:hypothetical protein
VAAALRAIGPKPLLRALLSSAVSSVRDVALCPDFFSGQPGFEFDPSESVRACILKYLFQLRTIRAGRK